jgi:hypothetical protein
MVRGRRTCCGVRLISDGALLMLDDVSEAHVGH